MNAQAAENADHLQFQAWLMSYSQDQNNDMILACMLASWQTGSGVLPDWFGLGHDGFIELLNFHFPGLDYRALTNPGRKPDSERLDEADELHRLLLAHRANESSSELWMAGILVNACQGNDHLWQDLGLWSRKQLSQLMQDNFPGLARRNDKDMKWKKFLYKQLCIAEGIYTCRAPSCAVCADFGQCFGPED